MIAAVKEAAQKGADLVVFSELSVCGYPPRDFLEFDGFIARCEESIAALKPHSAETGILVGAPCRNPEEKGKSLFNAAWLLYEGKVQQIAHKTCLPDYDVFDEYRYFEPSFSWKVMEFKGKRLAVTICEDIWNLGDDPLYRICPMDELIQQQPDVMINLSASPFDYNQCDKRLAVIRANVNKYKIPLFYCNMVGSQTEIVFDGGSVIADAGGEVRMSFPFFQEATAGMKLEDLWPAGNPKPDPGIRLVPAGPGAGESQDPPPAYNPRRHVGYIYDALIMAIRDYFGKMGFKKAILGSSGGIDSAVAVSLACAALGESNVRAALMPSPFSSSHSVDDAGQLSENLGNPYDIIPIDDIYEAFLRTLQPYFKGLPFNLAEENIQARTRGNLLMSLANKFGYILLNTSNKSELAVGYGTLYGDMAGGLSLLGDVYKTQVYALAEYINKDREIIPKNILTKTPSAELRPGQKDSDSLPEYDILDPILFQYIEQRKGPEEIVASGFDKALVNRILALVNTNEYKRNQFCPVIRVSVKAFGAGRRMPIVGKYDH